MPSTCVFEFDRPEPIYSSGETINGRIVLTTTNDKSCREMFIKFKGAAKTHWPQGNSQTVDGKSKHYNSSYHGEETYLDSRTSVHDEGVLRAGQHVYTFSIPLPLECPSSCVEEFGEIKYSIRLVIDRPFRYNNEFKQSLTVLKQVNLNLNPELLLPLSGEDIKHLCCFPCSSGQVVSTLIIPFGGYAPGQSLDYSLTIDNQSAKYDMEGIDLELRQTYCFTASSPKHQTRHHRVTLATASQEERILRLSKRTLKGDLVIPPVPPTSDKSGIITVSYDILMAINTGRCHTDSEITLPIKIGTVPLAQSAINFEKTPIQETRTSINPGDSPPSYESIKPSTFEQATSIKTLFIDADERPADADGFIPKYPMYPNFALPTAPDSTDGVDTVDMSSPNRSQDPTSNSLLTPLLPPRNNLG